MTALSVREASERILAALEPLISEELPLREALGRVLAADVISPVTLPPWDNSSMDGYAVRAADVTSATRSTPVTLPVLETIPAGSRPTRPLAPGTAIRIMTGAPLPAGADTVIRVEDTDAGGARVAIHDARDAGRNVRPRGQDLRAGDVAVARSTRLGAGQIGVLASVGAARVPVHREPHVAVLASGDELVDMDGFDAVRAGERIVSSNSYSISAAVRLAGGVPLELGIAADDRDVLRQRIEQSAHCDLLVTTGGVSVGEFDYTRAVLGDLGAELKFWRVRMRPGAPVGFGMLGALPWIGLPGNPVSALVTFELFARPAIARLRGEQMLFRRPVRVVADEPFAIHAPLTHFLRAVIATGEDGRWHARLTGPQGSGLLTSMSRADALVIMEPERPEIAAGETVAALLLRDDAVGSATLCLE